MEKFVKLCKKMKKNLLLLVCLSFISILVMGQKYEKTQKSNKIAEFKNRMLVSTSKAPQTLIKLKSLKANELEANQLVIPKTIQKSNLKSVIVEGKNTIDTTHTYPWNYVTQQWDTIPFARLLSYYDAKHNLIQYRALSWHGDTKSWVDSVQYFYKYNELNQVLNIIQQSWMFDGIKDYSWVNVDNSITEYNSLGQESIFVYQYWDYENSTWIDSWQEKFKYDSIGNNTLIIESYWDGASQWMPSINSINKFDTVKRTNLNLIQVWDDNSNNWGNAYQSIFGYDKRGNNNSITSQVINYDSGSWENCLFETIKYNSSNKIDSTFFQLWNPFLFDWVDSQRAIYKYDSIGNNICIVGENYDPYSDPNSDPWSNSWTNYYDYNAQNKQISSASLYWDSNMGIWATGSKTKSLKIKPFNQTVAEKPIITTLEIYPNPVSEIVNIQNNSAINQVRMFDMLGNEVLLNNYNGVPSIQLDMANMKSGVYILMVKDSMGNSTTKKLFKR